MKIEILSMQNVNNFGSLLQSYSLSKILREMGHEVYFIDIERRESDYNLLGKLHNRYESEREGASLKSKLKKIDRYTLNRLRIKKTSALQDQLFHEFRYDVLDIKQKIDHADYCIIGSDEVFNCLSASAWGFTSQLFGNVENADHVITYAASCGSTTFDSLPNSVKEAIKKAFSNIEHVSVRDANTLDFVTHFSNRSILEHLDPVLVGDFADEIATVKDIPWDLSKPYCIVYSYYNRIHQPDDIKMIKRFCKRHNLNIVAVGAPQMWIKDYYALSPFQMLKVFQNAAFVVTDTFHGAIFSYLYAKRFAIITRESNKIKLLDLVEKLEIQNHLLDDNCLETLFSVENNPAEVHIKLSGEIKRSRNYLLESLR